MARLRQIVVDCARPAMLAVERLVELGAGVRQQFDRHTWMVDIEGNDFCITDE